MLTRSLDQHERTSVLADVRTLGVRTGYLNDVRVMAASYKGRRPSGLQT